MGTVFLFLMQRCAKRKGQGQERVMEQEEKYIFYINTQKNWKTTWVQTHLLYLLLSDALVLDVNTGRNLLFQILLSQNGD